MENKIDTSITISRVTLISYSLDEAYNPNNTGDEINFAITL